MSHTETYKVKGMHCASCAGIIEKIFKKTDGVESVEVNYGTETAKIMFNESKTNPNYLSQKIKKLGYSLIVPIVEELSMSANEHAVHLGLNQSTHSTGSGLILSSIEVSKKEKLAEVSDMRAKVISAIPLAIFSAFVMGWDIFAQYSFIPAMSITTKEFFHHLLPIFATYTLFVVGKPYLLGFYRFLRYGKANMETLIGIGTSVAFFYSFIVTAFEESLRPFINVDNTYYDVTIVVITFIALGKYLEARSNIKMVEEAQGSKAPIQALADKISSIFVPVVLVLAFVALGIWFFIGVPYFGFSQALSLGLVSFVGILVIACPCALGLATPTAIIVGVGKGAKEGILIKDAATLQKLHKIDTLVVDKTGTITKGRPELASIQNFSEKSNELKK